MSWYDIYWDGISLDGMSWDGVSWDGVSPGLMPVVFISFICMSSFSVLVD